MFKPALKKRTSDENTLKSDMKGRFIEKQNSLAVMERIPPVKPAGFFTGEKQKKKFHPSWIIMAETTTILKKISDRVLYILWTKRRFWLPVLIINIKGKN